MCYKHGDWYCKPANKAEAIEIIERAVASGAKLHEFVHHSEETHDNGYGWNMYPHWGVYNGNTHTSDAAAYDEITLYTFKQVRELFPLPEIVAVSVQGKPIGFCEDTALALAERTFSTEIDEQLAEDVINFARRQYELYSEMFPAPLPSEQHSVPDESVLEESLKEILFPIRYMQGRLEEGEQLNGLVAVQLANDAEYLRDIAKAALTAYRKEEDL